jgi:hypothetical protein
MDQGYMLAFDPRSAIPRRWSLLPEDTLGLIFWTRNSRPLLAAHKKLKPYRKVIHFTLTGWHEVEKGAPSLEVGLQNLIETVRVFGAENVVWRFSPVPAVADAVDRFARIAEKLAPVGVSSCYLSFLQQNDRVPEPRTPEQRLEIVSQLVARSAGIPVLLCADDRELDSRAVRGVCESGARFGVECPKEKCGCALSVDPFTRNESCSYGCSYCYAADLSSSPKKRNTTLKVLP